MRKLFLLLVIGFLFTGLTFAQAEKEVDEMVGSGDVTMTKKSRGADPNIKVEKRLNDADVDSKAVQPTDKGAKASRGGYCDTYFDNWTDYYVDCYIDGYNEGYIAPWASGYVTVGAGTTKLYAVAEFTDGSRISWGPISKNCSSQTFKMTLYEDYYNWDLYY